MKKHSSFFRLLFSALVFCWGLAAVSFVQAGDLVVTRYFSGLWDQPKQESQGIVLNIIDQETEDGNPKAVAYWFTYGDDLGTAWYMAIGHVDGDRVVMTLYTAYGVGFMEDDTPEVSPVDVAGELVLTFRNCNHGTASYTIEGDAGERGEFEIKRLAALYNSRCSGGISDNTPSDAKPLMFEVKLKPVADDGAGEGKAKYWLRADRADFIVSAEELADGEYAIQVCEDVVGALIVEGGEGSTRFRSPNDEGDENLPFNPQRCPVHILLGDAMVLTSGDDVLDEKEKGPGKDKGPGEDKGDDDAKVEVEAEFDNTGVLDGAKGEAEYEAEEDGMEFEVEIENVPAGTYTFRVEGQDKGQIVISEDGGEGELKFSDPQEDDDAPLDFEPWGLEMTVEDGDGAVILTLTFPPSP